MINLIDYTTSTMATMTVTRDRIRETRAEVWYVACTVRIFIFLYFLDWTNIFTDIYLLRRWDLLALLINYQYDHNNQQRQQQHHTALNRRQRVV